MTNAKRWAALGALLVTLTIFWIVDPKLAMSAALIILFIGLGSGLDRGLFKL
jgi:hypothetical protein